MPEGPEVRRFADDLARALAGKKILSVSARTKDARAWLTANPQALPGRKILSVTAVGKNIIGIIDGGFYFYSHQMMWGRWFTHKKSEAPEVEKLERARIVTTNSVAILRSAPIFRVGAADPFKAIPYLAEIGPDCLPSKGNEFDSKEFVSRLKKHGGSFVGTAILDQSVVAGIGNYLRAEILFLARINPWTKVENLTRSELMRLTKLIPEVSLRAYQMNGVTVTDQLQQRMAIDDSLVYVPGKEYGRRHYVFRRTNLPCLICNEPVKQLRQSLAKANEVEEEALSRIMYFCAKCQRVPLATKSAKTARTGRPARNA